MNPRRLHPRIGLALAACLAASAAQAADPNADMRYLSVSTQHDARHNGSLLGTLSLPVGQRQWLQFTGGQTRVAQDAVPHRAGVLGVGTGYMGDAWSASVGATHRRDGERHRQTDWVATVEWRDRSFNIGLDGSYRDARQQGTVATPAPPGDTALVPVEQRVKGAGLGLHGGLMLGARTRLYAGAMRYDLRSRTRQNGSVSGAGANAPAGIVGALLDSPSLLARSLSTRASWVARDEAALSRSVLAGASHRFDQVALSAEYLGDKVLDAPGTMHTVQLKAALDLAPGWRLAPAVGRTRSVEHGGVNFGAVSMTRAW